MRCTHPSTAGLRPDGTLIWSPKQFRKEDRKIQFPCRKCIECRLAYSREWGIRSLHESVMQPENSFITLTYSDENLKDPKLNYEDFQVFIRALRDTLHQQPIKYIVAGEYGSKTKRPHWHAVLFGYKPQDEQFKYVSKSGHALSSSQSLDKIWGKGTVETGTVTLESASYCARYALKELEHGDHKDDYKPIFQSSRGSGIGASWLEKFSEDVFNYGRLYLHDGSIIEIPRYYQRWCEKHRPDLWAHYVTEIRSLNIARALTRAEKELNELWVRRSEGDRNANSDDKNKRRARLAKIRLEKLNQNLKEF